MVEALIALPVLLALCFGVSLLHELTATRQHALAQSRRCALLHAAAGCPRDLPAGCDAILGDGPGLEVEGPRATILDATRAAYEGSSFPLLERVPALADALTSLFGTTTRARTRLEVPTPSPEGDTLVVEGSMALLCNERETPVLEAAKKAVCASLGLDTLDLCGAD